jgi:hypothetical protein
MPGFDARVGRFGYGHVRNCGKLSMLVMALASRRWLEFICGAVF